MKRKFRLNRSTDFKRVRQSGKSYAHPLIVLIALPNETGRTRFGVAAGRSVGGAVQRNQAKRWLRETVRSQLAYVPPGWDVVLLARRPIMQADFQEVRAAVVALLRRARLWQERDGLSTASDF
ncbi:MAG: ribonuclease P protein component [Chloroflexota bacterium]